MTTLTKQPPTLSRLTRLTTLTANTSRGYGKTRKALAMTSFYLMVPSASTDHTKPPSLLATPLPTLCYLWEGGQRIRMEGGTLVEVIMVLRHRLWARGVRYHPTRVPYSTLETKCTELVT